MTLQQLKKFEAELEKRGYKKYDQRLTSKEAWGWFKTFARVEDEDGDTVGGYQVEFRVWDRRPFVQWGEEPFGLDFWTSPIGTDGRADCTANWVPICDIDTFERMAGDFYSMMLPYFK